MIPETNIDEAIAYLAHQLAYYASMHFSGQMDTWDESDSAPDRTVPKTSQDRTDSSAAGASSLN
jgi:hypothetical protein